MPQTQGAKSRKPAAPERRSRLARLQVLYRISNILTTTQRADTVLRLILKEAVDATRATSGSLILVDRASGVLNIKIARNIDEARANKTKLKIGEGVTGWVAKKGKPLLAGDVRRSRHYVGIKAGIKSELAVPIIIGGETVGIINVDSDRRDAFDEGDLEMMVAIGAQSAKVMQAANLYEENRHHAQRLSTLFEIAKTVASEPMLEDVLRSIADSVRELMSARLCSIMLLDEARARLEIKAASGDVSKAYLNRKEIPVADNIIGRAIETRKPLYVADVRKEKLYQLKRVARDSQLCSLLSVPMIFLGRPIGVLNIYLGERTEFSDEDVALISTFAGFGAVAIVNARRYERIFKTEELLRKSEKFQLLGLLSAEIAHEVRNPLTILTMLVHSMRNDAAITGQSRNDLGIIDNKLSHIGKIVDQVLDFSRSRQTDPVSVDLNQVLDDVLILVGHKASEMGRRVEKRWAKDLPSLIADPGQLEQAVLNLALNGLEAMRDSGDKLSVATRVIQRDGAPWIRIRVRDEGCGIPKEKISRIFTPFFSMRESGTGLGLFVTNRIVKDHGGLLEVKSRLGKGSTFDILLPVEAAETGEGHDGRRPS